MRNVYEQLFFFSPLNQLWISESHRQLLLWFLREDLIAGVSEKCVFPRLFRKVNFPECKVHDIHHDVQKPWYGSSLSIEKQLSELKKSRTVVRGGVLEKRVLKNFAKFTGKHPALESGVPDLRFFHVNSANFLRTRFCKIKVNGCFWKPCLFEFRWKIFRLSIWWRQ